MEVVAISTPNRFRSEAKIVSELFENGLQTFHLRKPKFSIDKTRDYLKLIPQKYHERIIIHYHYELVNSFKLKGIHLGRARNKLSFWTKLRIFFLRMKRPSLLVTASYHSLLSLIEDNSKYDYVILSPVFDSNSKGGHSAAFSDEQMMNTLMKCKHRVVALGGIDVFKVDKAQKMGFQGVALSGALWGANGNHVPVLKNLLDVASGKQLAIPEIHISPVKISL